MLARMGKLMESAGRLKDGVGGRVPGAEVAVMSHVASWALQAASAVLSPASVPHLSSASEAESQQEDASAEKR